MKRETPIELQLYVVYEGGYYSKNPIRLVVYPSHTPSLLLQEGIDKVLNLPVSARNPRRLYHFGKKVFLEDKKSYKQQKVKTGDCVVLTDFTDEGLSDLDTVMTLIYPSSVKPSQESRVITVIRGLLKGIPWIGHAIDAIIFGKD